MVDVSDELESKYVSVQVIKQSKSKLGVILGSGEYQECEFDKVKMQRLTLPIELDKKQKIWRPNKDSLKNMAARYGNDTMHWLGKRILFQVVTVSGKELVIASPYFDSADLLRND